MKDYSTHLRHHKMAALPGVATLQKMNMQMSVTGGWTEQIKYTINSRTSRSIHETCRLTCAQT